MVDRGEQPAAVPPRGPVAVRSRRDGPQHRVWALAIVAALGIVADVALARRPGDVVLPLVLGLVAATGTLLARRRPANSIGWLLLVAALLLAGAGIVEGWQQAGAGPRPAVASWLYAALFFPGFTLLLIPLPLLFPTGRPLTSRWRWPLWAALAFAVTNGVGNAIGESTRVGSVLVGIAGVPLLLGVLGALASLAMRYRRGDRTERLQLKWFFLGAAVTSLAVGVSDGFRDQPSLQEVVIAFGLMPLPVAIAIAVLRYRLYDIDRIISRTATYALVTAVLVGVYVVIAVVPAAMFDLESDLLVAGATLAAAAAFGPVRRHTQTVVDRRFNRSRYDARQVADAFALRLRDQVHLDALVGDLGGVVATTVQPATVSVWIRPGGGPA